MFVGLSFWLLLSRRIYRNAKQLATYTKGYKMRKIVVSEGVSLDGVFDAETMGKWAAPYYSDERDEFVEGLSWHRAPCFLGERPMTSRHGTGPIRRKTNTGSRTTKTICPSTSLLQRRSKRSGITRRSLRTMS